MKNAGMIEGWMTHRELQCLYEWSKYHHHIVEVGSWKGRSTSAFLQAKRDKYEETGEFPGWVFAVDTWQGSPAEIEDRHAEAKERNILQQFLENVGDSEWLIPLQMKSSSAARSILLGVDVVFIDASHNYEDVKEDLELWGKRATKLLCGHDWTWPSVRQAVTEYAIKHSYEVRVIEGTSLWFIQKGN